MHFTPPSCKISLKGPNEYKRRKNKYAGKEGRVTPALETMCFLWGAVETVGPAWAERREQGPIPSPGHIPELLPLSAGPCNLQKSIRARRGLRCSCLSPVNPCGDRVKRGPYFSPASSAGCVWPWEVAESGLNVLWDAAHLCLEASGLPKWC